MMLKRLVISAFVLLTAAAFFYPTITLTATLSLFAITVAGSAVSITSNVLSAHLRAGLAAIARAAISRRTTL